MSDLQTFRLSGEEVEMLIKLVANNAPLHERLSAVDASSDSCHSIPISHAEAALLRDTLTIHLAKQGFDAEYCLNRDGRLLQGIIDKLPLQ